MPSSSSPPPPPRQSPADPAEPSAPSSPSKFPGSSKEDCERYVDNAVERDPTVKFMMEKLNEAGCSVSRSFIRVEPCDEAVGGGFRPPDGVVLCHNHLPRAADARAALVHELVHAYDHCRAGSSLDWSDCDHHACSEVRAAALSGDCSFGAEVSRGNWGLRAQAQVCARRRAALSVAMNPACRGSGASKSKSGTNSSTSSNSSSINGAFAASGLGNSNRRAQEAVDRVFDVCYADTAPFDRMP